MARSLAVSLARGASGRVTRRLAVVLRGDFLLAAARLGSPAGRLLALLAFGVAAGASRLALRGRACGAGELRSALASSKATASSSVTFSGVLSFGKVALTPAWLT